MKYDFDAIIPRSGTNSYKWDSLPQSDILPMWVADMDFLTAPVVTDAIRKKVEHGIFCYTRVPNSYYEAIIDWFDSRYRWKIQSDWILYTTGVGPALSAIIQALLSPGDKVLVQPPVYHCFFSYIRNNGCEVETSYLTYENGRYTIDKDDLEKKTKDPAVKCMILCNPHNPVGRVWLKEELEMIASICRKNGVLVVADEIHGDLTYQGHEYTPFASLSEETLHYSITCTSPSKGFNMAGIQVANIIVANKELRQKIEHALSVNEVCYVNSFAVEALEAAYHQGAEWLEELKLYLYKNYEVTRAILNEKLPQLRVLPLEGTYLVWIDCSAVGISSKELVHLLETEGRILVNDGEIYGETEGCFIRLNIACPRKLLLEGLNRFCRTLCLHIPKI